jgi:hypothetical protein
MVLKKSVDNPACRAVSQDRMELRWGSWLFKRLKDIVTNLLRGNWGTALETVGDVSDEADFFDRLQ